MSTIRVRRPGKRHARRYKRYVRFGRNPDRGVQDYCYNLATYGTPYPGVTDILKAKFRAADIASILWDSPLLARLPR